MRLKNRKNIILTLFLIGLIVFFVIPLLSLNISTAKANVYFVEKDVITNFHGTDTVVYDPGNLTMGMEKAFNEEDFKYFKETNVNGDGIDTNVSNFLKVTGFNSDYMYFGLKLNNKIKIADILSIKVRYFSNLGESVSFLWYSESHPELITDGSGDLYKSLIPEQNEIQVQWGEKVIDGDSLKHCEDANGYFSNLIFVFHKLDPTTYSSDAYFVLDSINYTYNCEITFDYDKAFSSKENEKIDVVSDTKLTKPTDFELGGYNIDWYIDEAKTTLFDFANDVVKDNMTLYAKYVKKMIKVTIDRDVSLSGISEKSFLVDYNQKITEPSGMLPGYTVKWYKDSSFTDEFDFGEQLINDTTLFAKYSKIGGEEPDIDQEDDVYDDPVDTPDSGNEEARSGCNGSINGFAGTIIALATVTGVGIVYFILKRKKLI